MNKKPTLIHNKENGVIFQGVNRRLERKKSKKEREKVYFVCFSVSPSSNAMRVVSKDGPYLRLQGGIIILSNKEGEKNRKKKETKREKNRKQQFDHQKKKEKRQNKHTVCFLHSQTGGRNKQIAEKISLEEKQKKTEPKHSELSKK